MRRSSWFPVRPGLLFTALLGLAAVTLSGPGCTVPDPLYCANNDDCLKAGGTSRPICDPIDHVCRVLGDGGSLCVDNTTCTDPALSRCDRVTLKCAPCVSDGDCGGQLVPPRPHCVFAGSSKLCVECTTDSDCTSAARPICDNHSCRGCQAHSECGPGTLCNGQLCMNKQMPTRDGSEVCISSYDDQAGMGGHCAADGDSGQVIYVAGPSAVNPNCNDNLHGTTIDMPKCTVESAIDQARMDGRPYVRIFGAYSLFKVVSLNSSSAGRLILVGAPTKVQPSHAVVQAIDTLFQVLGGDKLTLDTLDILEKTPSRVAVNCDSSSLTLRGCTMRGSTTSGMPIPGISLTNCDGVMDGNMIGVTQDGDSGAHGIGLRLIDTSVMGHTFVLQNNIIAGNVGAAMDLAEANNAKITFRFNTLVKNGGMASFGGVLCPLISPAPVILADSIIAGNSTATNGKSQFLQPDNCSLQQDVVGKTEMQMAINLDPDLTATFRLKLSGPNNDCCIDKVSQPPSAPQGTPPVDHDIDGISRPQGKGWDIGASEVPQM